MRARRWALLAGALVWFGAENARADERKREADALFERGKAELRTGDWVKACASFRESFERDASVSTSVKIARCHEHDQKHASALFEYRRALELNQTLSRSRERQRELEELVRRAIADLEPKVPRLRLAVTPAPEGLELRIDGMAVPYLSGDVSLLDPGEHEVRVRAPGYREANARVTLMAGEERSVELVLAAETAEPKALPAPRTDPPPAPLSAPSPARGSPSNAWSEERIKPPGTGRRTLGLVLGGAGVVSLGVAAYFAIRTYRLVDDAERYCDFDAGECDRPGVMLIDQAHDAELFLWIFGAAGVVATGAGVVLVVTAKADARRGSADSVPPAEVTFALDAGGASVRGSF